MIRRKTKIVIIVVAVLISSLILCLLLLIIPDYNNQKREHIALSLGAKHADTVHWQNVTLNLPANVYYIFQKNGEEIEILDPITIKKDRSALFISKFEYGNIMGKDLLERTNQGKDMVVSSGEIDFKGHKAYYIEQRNTQGDSYVKSIHVFQKNIIIGILGKDKVSLRQFDQVLDSIEFDEK